MNLAMLEPGYNPTSTPPPRPPELLELRRTSWLLLRRLA
jgi:hypothetical protein